MSNLAEILATTVEQHGDRIAVKLDDLELTYAVLDAARRARRRAAARRRGSARATASGCMLPNVPYFPFLFYGALRLGAVVVPMNPLLKEREVAFHLGDSGRQACCVAWHEFAEARAGRRRGRRAPSASLVEPGEFEQRSAPPSRSTDDRRPRRTTTPRVILYTSGTTGHAQGRRAHARATCARRAEIARDLVDAGPETRHASARCRCSTSSA